MAKIMDFQVEKVSIVTSWEARFSIDVGDEQELRQVDLVARYATAPEGHDPAALVNNRVDIECGEDLSAEEELAVLEQVRAKLTGEGIADGSTAIIWVG